MLQQNYLIAIATGSHTQHATQDTRSKTVSPVSGLGSGSLAPQTPRGHHMPSGGFSPSDMRKSRGHSDASGSTLAAAAMTGQRTPRPTSAPAPELFSFPLAGQRSRKVGRIQGLADVCIAYFRLQYRHCSCVAPVMSVHVDPCMSKMFVVLLISPDLLLQDHFLEQLALAM